MKTLLCRLAGLSLLVAAFSSCKTDPGVPESHWNIDSKPAWCFAVLEVFDVFGQLIAGGGGDQREQGVENLVHSAIVVSCNVDWTSTFVVPRYVSNCY